MRKYRAIFAPSYSGSTLLSSLINSFKLTTSIGELHWALDQPLERVRCSECGKRCPIVGGLIRRRERCLLNDANLYPTVLDITRKTNLWTSDKHRNNVVRFLPQGGDGAIIIFKSPEQQYSSGKRHGAPWTYTFLSHGSIYINMYSILIDWLPLWTKRIYFCDYNKLTKDPQTELQSIACYFGHEFKPKGLVYPPENWHNMFGNSAWKNSYFNRTIKQDTRWQTELTEIERDRVLKCPAQEMHRRLVDLANASREGK